MKEVRQSRGLRERKSQLAPDAERLVSAALGLSHSGSRTEDRYWEASLSARLERLLEGGHTQALNDALDRLNQTDTEAYSALIEAVEDASEALVLEVDGQKWQCLLVSAPLVVWTRFRIPAGPLSTDLTQSLSAHWQAHILSANARFRLAPYLYSIDQTPRDFAELRRLTRKLGQAAVSGQAPRLDLKALPETAEMLADNRFLIGVVAVPQGEAIFRWQETEAGQHASRVQCLEQWVAQGRPNLEPLFPGCGFECLLPDAYHLNMREADRRVRPYSIRAAVHFLVHTLSIKPSDIQAAIAAFGSDRVDEFRIGLSVGDSEEVAQGVVWPLLGAESEADDPSPLEVIRATLREAGVNEIRVWSDLEEPDFCEDCGSPLYPNGKGEIVHADMPEDAEPEATHFH